MKYERVSQQAHPLPLGTQARACSLRHGWIFGPIVWIRKAVDPHVIYTVQDQRRPHVTTDVVDYQVEIHSEASDA
jgi:hypothetical protein